MLFRFLRQFTRAAKVAALVASLFASAALGTLCCFHASSRAFVRVWEREDPGSPDRFVCGSRAAVYADGWLIFSSEWKRSGDRRILDGISQRSRSPRDGVWYCRVEKSGFWQPHVGPWVGGTVVHLPLPGVSSESITFSSVLREQWSSDEVGLAETKAINSLRDKNPRATDQEVKQAMLAADRPPSAVVSFCCRRVRVPVALPSVVLAMLSLPFLVSYLVSRHRRRRVRLSRGFAPLHPVRPERPPHCRV